MLRMLLLLVAVSLIFSAAIVSAPMAAVHAQAPASGGMQTVSSPAGYQYQVPSDWQQIPNSLLERMGNQSFNVDGEAASSDGSLHTHVETATNFGIGASDLPTVLSNFFNTPSGAGATLSVFDGPTPAQVPSAESAISGAAQYADVDGTPRVVAARVALRGDSAYLLAVDVTQDFYANNPIFGQIMSSFRLTTRTSSAVPSLTAGS